MKAPYHQTFRLKKDIENVECWNRTGPERFTLPAGLLLKLEHAYDSSQTTCMAQNEDGTSREVFPFCYRWIIPNDILGEAIGVKMSKKTTDLVGDIIAYESGEATPKQAKRLLSNPICRHLQGHYSSRCTAP